MVSQRDDFPKASMEKLVSRVWNPVAARNELNFVRNLVEALTLSMHMCPDLVYAKFRTNKFYAVFMTHLFLTSTYTFNLVFIIAYNYLYTITYFSANLLFLMVKGVFESLAWRLGSDRAGEQTCRSSGLISCKIFV